MKRFLLIGASLCCCGGVAMSQVPESFQQFRQGILDDYQEFRRTILDHYADFLEGTWHEYETLLPVAKDETPKPLQAPAIQHNKPAIRALNLPTPHRNDIPVYSHVPDENKKIDPALTQDGVNPVAPVKPKMPLSLLGVPDVDTPPEAIREVPDIQLRRETPRPIINVSPVLPASPVLAEGVEMPPIPPYQEEPEEESADGKEVVKFYGMNILVPEIDFKISSSLGKASDLARHWKILEEQDVAELVEENIMPKIRQLGLNDYLTYEFLSAYLDAKFPQATALPKMSTVHYILANQGHDVRIALTADTAEPVMLMPSDRFIFATPYLEIEGRKYFLMAPPGVNLNGVRLATCALPKVAQSGKPIQMRIDGLNLPMKERPFQVSNGNITLSGVLNENLMPLVYRYPQMDTEGFAVSALDKNLRQNLVEQIKSQLGDKEPLSAANELLKFMQFAFDYATDDEAHGFEKPYFLEENFYYPKNDCEDRAIFYTYMLWNALGIENQLLAFPGHESASLSIPGASINGSSYNHEGKTYYISDPTYIGATTGQCMRQFETVSPTIDHSYPH